jgi:hypothetical protein
MPFSKYTVTRSHELRQKVLGPLSIEIDAIQTDLSGSWVSGYAWLVRKHFFLACMH